MNKSIKKASGKNYYALLCACSADDIPLVCGVYADRKEANEIAEEIKECVTKHRIVKCSVKITY